MRQDGCDYFTDFWNLNDIMFVAILIATTVSDYYYDTSDPEDPGYEMTRIFYAILVLVSFIKLLSLFRIFDNMSFIIRMLFKVVVALLPFLGLFAGFLTAFTFVVVALKLDRDELENDGDPYEGLSGFGYALFILRTSLGDFSVDPFKSMSPTTSKVMWVLWIILIFCNTIIFLNFIIAVISDAYEQVIETRTEEIFQKKAQLLVDLENVFENPRAKHSHILITRSSSVLSNEVNWGGIV